MSYFRSISLERFKLPENQETPFFLGLQLFLYISLMRGFLSASIVYLLDILQMEQYIAGICAILPIIASPFLVKFIDPSTGTKLILLLWTVAAVSPFLLLNFVLFILLLALSYANLIRLFQISLTNFEFLSIGVYFLFFDHIFRSISSGNDPTTTNSIFSIIIVLVVSLPILMTPFNANKETTNKSVEPFLIQSIYSFGFITSLTLYFLYFGNPGQIVPHMGIYGYSAVSIYFIGSLLIVTCLIIGQNYIANKIGIIVSGALMTLGVISNWSGIGLSVIWFLSFFGNIVLISFYTSKLVRIGFQNSKIFMTTLLINFALLFLTITADGTIFSLVILFIAILPLVFIFKEDTL